MKTAVAFGADAVYCGLPTWSLRNMREITFTLATLKEGIDFAHKNGVKVYLTFNVFPHQAQMKKLEKDLKELQILNRKFQIDGVIVADLGMFSLLPEIRYQLSGYRIVVLVILQQVWSR